MKIGFSLPNLGTNATPEGILKVARKAEELGYDSLWTVERLLYPVNPQTPYPVTPDGSLPDLYKYCLDPLETLTYVAGHTKKISLGTSVLDIPYYNPVMLARRLSTLDVLSGGRLKLGLGLGWSQDEYDATGASMKGRGALADEFLQVLKAIWTTDPVEFQGKHFKVPKSIINPKPVQKPHPPIYMAAFAPKALERIGKMADGWNPTAIPVAGMEQMFAGVKEAAKAAGRDPASMQMVVRANLIVTEKPVEKDRFIFVGSEDQIKEDIEGCRKLGAEELFFDPSFGPDGNSLDAFMNRMEQMRKFT